MSLTNRDTNVLDALFEGGGDITSAGLQGIKESNTALPAEEFSPVSPIPETMLAGLKKREVEGVALAEKDDLDGALLHFSAVISQCAKYASAYNNRAQVYRLQNQYDAALDDLAMALKYSNGDPKVLKQAYTQRAIIKRARGDTDGAFYDFELGGKYGNPVAKDAAVLENPYSKLCNAIMKESLAQMYQQK
ncbi:hypothetical protein H4R33_001913 [Dimargaris cristalligena]|uniref:Uncharacterized protein n=1 Tax=Dimargaris cristalligena TaxID=215637 RepID=A0A4P9ZXA0_9FUNG|nr:hypothetical protein H4R33_001913 [Dimargaris cristalligena]RKP38273.1 hypothetical protein BJ085DRAFT_36297 [Dimargaris cristalligena]|eukprot:RKP38273.1 hypothetical protein BJ085DRAFT_36297 [Dimargaris cristalligena]